MPRCNAWDSSHCVAVAQVPVDVATLGYWPQIVVTAVQKGFCGALSTVSTLVNEVDSAAAAALLYASCLRHLWHTSVHRIQPGKSLAGCALTHLVVSIQMHGMLEVYPDRFHAYTYPLASFAAAWLTGLAVYGAAAWAHM